MDRLAEQVVAWHNSHPLAKRISIYDVHTIGVVALPFMRSGSAAMPGSTDGPRGPIEPVLTDAVSTESLAAWGTEESTIAANTNAAQLDALADQEEPPPGAGPLPWRERLLKLFRRDAFRIKPGDDVQIWPAFSERFVENLSARRVARFAEEHGFTIRPGDATWPNRIVPIDDQKMTRDGAVGGAWPFEIYLMSAAVDAGRSRSRILAGRRAGGFLPPIIGRRCLSPKRVGIAALLPLCVISAASAAWLGRSGGHDETLAAAASAASAASAPVVAAASAASAIQVAVMAPPEASAPASEAASALVEAPAGQASGPALVASTAGSTPASGTVTAEAAAASAPERAPDIRPHLVDSPRAPGTPRPPLRNANAEPAKDQPVVTAASSPKPVAAAASNTKTETATAAAPEKLALPMPLVPTDVQEAARKGTAVVALVAPPTKSKAEAEATLAKMRELVAPLQPDPKLMQGQVFESPEGWRPAVWPFASRIEAQLVNATLVARGLHTKAVNF